MRFVYFPLRRRGLISAAQKAHNPMTRMTQPQRQQTSDRHPIAVRNRALGAGAGAPMQPSSAVRRPRFARFGLHPPAHISHTTRIQTMGPPHSSAAESGLAWVP